jgi:hypothetical protein
VSGPVGKEFNKLNCSRHARSALEQTVVADTNKKSEGNRITLGPGTSLVLAAGFGLVGALV